MAHEQEEEGIVEGEVVDKTVENEVPAEGPQGGPQRAVLTAAKRIVYDPKVSKELLKIIESAPDPVQGIAQACVMVLRIIHSESKGAKGMGAAALGAVIPMVIELAVKAGLVEPSEELGAQVLEAVKALVMQQKQSAGPAEQSAQPPAPPGGPAGPQPMGGMQ